MLYFFSMRAVVLNYNQNLATYCDDSNVIAECERILGRSLFLREASDRRQ